MKFRIKICKPLSGRWKLSLYKRLLEKLLLLLFPDDLQKSVSVLFTESMVSTYNLGGMSKMTRKYLQRRLPYRCQQFRQCY